MIHAMLQLVTYGILEDVFGNAVTDSLFGVFILVGILIGILFKPFVGNKVFKFDPSDHRFHELDVQEETAISIECKEKKGMPPQKFYKHQPGFTGMVGRIIKRPVTLFLGRTGTAYTWKLEGGTWKNLKGLSGAIKTLWGETFYETIPEEKRKLLEKDEIQVTVGLAEDPLTPEGRKPINEEDIHKEEDRAAARTFWEEHAAKTKAMIINVILAAGFGFGICAALFLLGIFKMPAPVVVTANPNPAPTAQMAFLALKNLMVK